VPVTAIVIAMLVIVVIAVVVVVYVAYPHRGAELPAVPWLGDAMSKAVDALPTVEPDADGGTFPLVDDAVEGERVGRHAAGPDDASPYA
jgi:hypothetical protein